MRIGLPKMIRPFLMVVFLLTTLGLFAQNVSVKGVVISGEDNTAIPGVNVSIKGTTTGTVTNLDGQFELQAAEGDVIVLSFIGFLKEEISVSAARADYSVTLKSDAVDMDEVVVIGYGTQKKSDMTGAVSAVSSAEITRKSVATIEQAMQGLTAGVTVTSNSGAPGEGAKVRIRGVGSINNTDPLYVIDGVPVSGTGSTNPADIESMSVLKDAAACAIYGARGANGVVMITTKKGKKGFHVNFDAQAGVQQEWKRMDLLNSKQYALLVNESADNLGRRGPRTTMNPDSLANDTDWQEEMFQLAPTQRYNLSVSGGNDLGNYSVSGGYLNQKGIMLSTGYEKLYARVNTELKYKRFRVGQSFAFNHSNKDNEKNGYQGRNTIEQMLKATPTTAVYDTAEIGGYAGPSANDDQDAVNPVAIANMFLSKTKQSGMLGNVFGEVDIIEGLKYKLSFGFDIYNQENTYHEPEFSMGDYTSNGNPKWDTTLNESNYTLIENLLTYSKKLQDHEFDLLAGYSQERKDYTTQGFNTVHYLANDSIGYQVNQEYLYESGLVSYLGRVNYAFAGKYLFQANIRRDGSSKFGKNKRWGVFPSVSGGWVLSKESFMESVPQLSYAKVRGSWGQIGNQNINDYQYESNLNINQSYVYGDNEVDGTGPSGFPNPNVQWETAIQSNVGLDLGLLENRINITAEYYNNVTEDMLIQIPMPSSNGSTNFPFQNAGSVKNSGFELMLNYRKKEGAFQYSVTGNITTINNEVLSLGVGDKPIVGGNSSELEYTTKTAVGQPIGSFYGFVTDGIYASEEEINAMNAETIIDENGVEVPNVDDKGEAIVKFAPKAKPGDIRFKDLDGDGRLTAEDRAYIGSPIPDFTYGINFSGSYKNFDFSVSFQGVQGNSVMRETKMWTEGMATNFNASTDVLNRYRAEDVIITTGSGDEAVDTEYTANTNTGMPRAIKNDANKNSTNFSDRYIEDGSYMRLKDLTIGYNLPKSMLERFKLGSARVYFSGLNLLTITNYTGFDPEIGGGNTSTGIDEGYFPQARVFLGGLQISF